MVIASPAIPIILFGVAAMGAGALLAWFILSLGGDGGASSEVRSAESAPLPLLAPRPAEGEELLSVRRVEGEVAVFVGGERYLRLEDVKDPQLGRDAVAGLKAVLDFAEKWLPLRRPPAVPTAAAAPPLEGEEFLELLEQAAPLHLREFKPPAEAIDDLIQDRLRRWPDLVGEKVRMSTAADGTLRIHVGLQVFRRVEDVPDPKVRALIRDAVREWEQGGG